MNHEKQPAQTNTDSDIENSPIVGEDQSMSRVKKAILGGIAAGGVAFAALSGGGEAPRDDPAPDPMAKITDVVELPNGDVVPTADEKYRDKIPQPPVAGGEDIVEAPEPGPSVPASSTTSTVVPNTTPPTYPGSQEREVIPAPSSTTTLTPNAEKPYDPTEQVGSASTTERGYEEVESENPVREPEIGTASTAERLPNGEVIITER